MFQKARRAGLGGRKRAALSALTVMLLAPAAGAASREPTLRNVQYGFGARGRNLCWAPLTVDIVNPGPATVAELEASSDGRLSLQRVTSRKTVRLPPAGFLRTYLPCFVDLEDIGKPVRTVAGVTLGGSGLAAWDRLEALGDVRPEGAPAHLVCDARAVSYNFLSPSPGSGEPARTRTVVLPRDFPSDALALSSFDTIVLGDPGDEPMRPECEAALLRWVEAGGVLVCVPPPSGARAAGPRTPFFVPAAYPAAHSVSTLPELAPWGEPPVAEGEGFTVRTMEPLAGRIVAGDAGQPLAVAAVRGQGVVVALSFDAGHPAFQGWPGAYAFWRAAVPVRDPLVRHAVRLLERGPEAPRVMNGLAGFEVASRRLVATYLGGVFVLLSAALAGLRLARRPATGWAVAILLAAGIGSAVALLAVRAGRRMPARLLEVYYAQADPDGQGANVHAAMGWFTPRDATLSFPLPPGAAVRPGIGPVQTRERFGILCGPPRAVDGLRGRARSIRPFAMALRSGEPVPLRASLRFDARGLSLETNHGGTEAAEDAFLLVRRCVVPLGDIAPGGAAERPGLLPPPPEEGMQFSARTVRRAVDLQRQALRERLFPPFAPGGAAALAGRPAHLQAIARPYESEPALFAWSDRSAGAAGPDAGLGVAALGLWRYPLEVRYAGDRILLPRGTLEQRVVHRAPSTRYHPAGTWSGFLPDRIEVAFAPPPGCPGLQVGEVRAAARFESDAFDLRVFGRSPDGRLVPLLDGTGTAPWPGPAGAPAGTMTLVAEIRPRAAPAGEGQAVLGTSRAWYLRELELELLGTRRPAPDGPGPARAAAPGGAS